MLSFLEFLAEAKAYDRDKVWDEVKDRIYANMKALGTAHLADRYGLQDGPDSPKFKNHYMDNFEKIAPNDKAVRKIANMWADGGSQAFSDVLGAHPQNVLSAYHSLVKGGNIQGAGANGYDVGAKNFKTIGDFQKVIDTTMKPLWDKHGAGAIRQAHSALFSTGGPQYVEPGPSSRDGNPLRPGASEWQNIRGTWMDTHEVAARLRYAAADGESDGRDKTIGPQVWSRKLIESSDLGEGADLRVADKLAGMHASGAISKFEDVESTGKDVFTKYAKLHKTGVLTGEDASGFEPDSKFKSLQDYRDVIKKYTAAFRIDPTEGLEEGKDYKVVSREHGATVYHALTQKAGQHLGRSPDTGEPTAWCTAVPKSRWFNEYAKDGPLLQIHPDHPEHEGEVYQYHAPGRECMDKNNQEIDRRHAPDRDDEYSEPEQMSHVEALNDRFPNKTGQGRHAGIGDVVLDYTARHLMSHQIDKALDTHHAGVNAAMSRVLYYDHEFRESLPKEHAQALDLFVNHVSTAGGHIHTGAFINSQSKIYPMAKQIAMQSANGRSAILAHPNAGVTGNDLLDIASYHDRSIEQPAAHMNHTNLIATDNLYNAIANHPAFNSLSASDKATFNTSHDIVKAQRAFRVNAGYIKEDVAGVVNTMGSGAISGGGVNGPNDILVPKKYRFASEMLRRKLDDL